MGKYRAKKLRPAPVKIGTKAPPGYSELEEMYRRTAMQMLWLHRLLANLMEPDGDIDPPQIVRALKAARDTNTPMQEVFEDAFWALPSPLRAQLVTDLVARCCPDCGQRVEADTTHACADGLAWAEDAWDPYNEGEERS